VRGMTGSKVVQKAEFVFFQIGSSLFIGMLTQAPAVAC
jgi:hypothetical protein